MAEQAGAGAGRRLWRRRLGDVGAPTAVLRKLRDRRAPVALIGDWAGSQALISCDPVTELSDPADPFAVLDRQPPVRRPVDAIEAVGGGWFGYLGYQLGGRFEALDPQPPARLRLPQAQLAFYEDVLRLDADGSWWFEALLRERDAAPLARLAQLEQLLRAPAPAVALRGSHWRPDPGWEGHREAIESCRARIRAGDLFQANLTVRLQSELADDPLDMFCAAVELLAPRKAAFLGPPWGAVASLSPELFLRRRGRQVLTAPIKGTRAADAPPTAAGLEASGKERAENVMIVDLMRNDLGRVCEPGSIHVRELAVARADAGVTNLVSTISGRLPEGLAHARLLEATFPPGSVVGAPKIAAQNVIAELESTAREVYTGAIGFAGPLAGLDLNVAIRTLETHGRTAWLGVGGGIVADSQSTAEVDEARVKAAPLLGAFGGKLAGPGEATGLAPAPRRGPRPTPRPDPAGGVFETLLVRAGRIPYLHDHLDRLRESASRLYGAEPPHGLAGQLRAAAAMQAEGVLRADLLRGRRGLLESTIVARALPLGGGDLGLRVSVLPGGLGPHKWSDRGLIAEREPAPDNELALFADLDGFVLEASRASLFAVIAGELVTAPLDGRILPSTTRARVIGLARARGLPVAQRALRLSELRHAEAVFLTSAVRRLEPVAALDGRRLGSGPVVRELARADAEQTARMLEAEAAQRPLTSV